MLEQRYPRMQLASHRFALAKSVLPILALSATQGTLGLCRALRSRKAFRPATSPSGLGTSRAFSTNRGTSRRQYSMAFSGPLVNASEVSHVGREIPFGNIRFDGERVFLFVPRPCMQSCLQRDPLGSFHWDILLDHNMRAGLR